MRIFICYSRADRALVEPLWESLVEAGHEGWFDAFILPGQDWKERLRTEILECAAFVYVSSPASNVSDWCQWELATAIELRRPIVPVVVVAGTSPPGVLAGIQHADLSDDPAGQNLLRLLGGLAALRVDPSGAPAAPASPLGVPVHVSWSNPSAADLGTVGVVDGRSLGREADRRLAEAARRIPPGNGPYVGIDFGTVTSLVAVVEDGRPVAIPNGAGHYETPSAVAVTRHGELIVGEAARLLAQVSPERAVLYPKRLVGTSRQLYVDGVAHSAAGLVSCVLRQLVADATRYLGQSVGGAVVSVPAYFGQPEMHDMRTAALLADLSLLRLLAEPTAAAFAATSGVGDETLAVYDLGGGTFDISIIEEGEEVWEVKGIAGDSHLGGADYDRALVRYCVSEFLAATGVNLANNPVALMRIREACEAAKVALSTVGHAAVQVPFIHGDGHEALNLHVPVTRHKFEDLTLHLTDATIEACRAAIRRAFSPRDGDAEWRDRWLGDLDGLLLVGLATRTPSVREAVEGFFGHPSRRGFEPDRVVAAGAALQAAVIQGRVRNRLLLNAVSHGLYIDVADASGFAMVDPSQTIPTRCTRGFKPAGEGQPQAVIVVREKSASGPVVGRIVVDLPKSITLGPFFAVTLDLDANGDAELRVRIAGSLLAWSCQLGQPEYEVSDVDGDGALAIDPVPTSIGDVTVALDDLGRARDVANRILRDHPAVSITVEGGLEEAWVQFAAFGSTRSESEDALNAAKDAVVKQLKAVGVRSTRVF